MKPILLITGYSGIGKSHRLQAAVAKSQGRVRLCDLFEQLSFEAPDSRECEVLAVDHLTPMSGVFDAAVDWCKAHDKTLCVATQNRGDIERRINIPAGSVELRMYREGNTEHLKVIRSQDSFTFALGPDRSAQAVDEWLSRVSAFLPQGPRTATSADGAAEMFGI